MKHKAPLISTFALTLAMGLGAFMFAGSTPAQAGSYSPPAEEDCGCTETPPPPPPPEEDCGCEDDHGGGKGAWNWNKNHNENTNTNTNTNTNNNNVVVNVNTNSTASASATAAANAVANANLANQVSSNSNSSSASRSGGSGYGIGNGNGSGGGGGSYYIAPQPAMSMGALNVVVREAAVEMKPVKGVCVSAKGLEEMARYSTQMRELTARDETEVFHCLAGDMLVVTIGRMVGSVANYDGGYVIECSEGEALRFGTNGLACSPRQANYSRRDAGGEGRTGYAEVFISKASRNETTASAAVGAGMATYNGGVGY